MCISPGISPRVSVRTAKLVGVGAAAVTVGWVATRILGHVGTILRWMLDPVVWIVHLFRWLLTPLRWALEGFPAWAIHGFIAGMLLVGVGLIVGRAAILGLRAGDRRMRQLRHRAVQESISSLEGSLLAEKQSGVREL